MSIVYGLLLFALLVLILYATWQPSSIEKPRPVQNKTDDEEIGARRDVQAHRIGRIELPDGRCTGEKLAPRAIVEDVAWSTLD